MITVMRRYRTTLQIGLLLVIAAFVMTSIWVGASSTGGADRADAVASVNGEMISNDRYQRAYQNAMNMYMQAGRGSMTSEMADRMGLPRMVTDQLVQEAVIVQKARAEGLEATDDEVNVQVHAIRAFHEDGRFTRRRFEEVLRRAGLREAAFVDDVRRELTVRKVLDTVRNSVKVSDAELEQAFVTKNEQVRALWALVEVAPLAAAATATDEEAAEHLKAHAADFQQPERRKVQYVTFAPKDFTRPVKDADVEKFHTENAKEFETPRQVRAAHVLVRVPDTGGSEAEDKAKAKAADVIRRARAGEDFAKLAKELSEDPGSQERGGDLGFVSKGEMVPQFEEALFALKKGEISPEPVRTPFGFHAIKVAEIKEGGRKPLKDVAGPIRDRLAAEASEQAAKAKADEIRPALQGAKDFIAEARKLGLTPVETTMSKVDRPAMGVTDTLEEAVFTLAMDGVSAPVKTPAGWVLAKPVQSLPAGVPPLADIKDRVVAAVKREKAIKVAEERAKQLAAEAKHLDWAAATRKVSAVSGETPRFSRSKPAERLPGDVQLAALQTPAAELAGPVRTPQGFYVLKVLERIVPNVNDMAADRDKLLREVTSQKQSQVWERWVSGARASAKIEMFGRTGQGPRG